MKTATLISLALWLTLVRGQANETYKACQTVMTCFQDAEDEIDKCLSILVGEKSASSPTEPPRPRPPPLADDCMAPVKEKIKQKKTLDKERVVEFKKCLSLRIEGGAEDVDPRKYRYCTTVTGRYQNKTTESGTRFKRQALPELPTTQAPSNASIISSVSHSTAPTPAGISALPIQSSSASTTAEIAPSGEPKNATSGGGVDPLPAINASSSLLESSSSSPHSSASIPLNPASPIAINPASPLNPASPIGLSASSIGLNSSPISGAPEISTQEHTSPKSEISTHSGIIGSTLETSTLKVSEAALPSNNSGSPILTGVTGTTTAEVEYEYSGSSGGSSSEVGVKPAPPNPVPVNPVVETLNQHNISEPAGPTLENSTSPVAEPSVSTSSPSPISAHPPGAKAPGGRPNGRPQKPLNAQDIDAAGADQENQQRVKIEVQREARRRLSEFKGCMARARIKREECKPLVRCCPDTAICHLNYESSDLHNKVHKLESEILQGRQDCLKRKRALNKDELADAMDQIDAEELISDDSVVSQIIF